MYLILGFTNRTSYALAKYLLHYEKKEIVIADQNSTEEQQKLLSELPNNYLIHNELGVQKTLLLSKYNIEKIFLSPGVPRNIAIIEKAISLGIEVLNDIELFYQLFPERKYIAITGTDGKTTVATWLEDLISREYQVVLCGNIGIPIFDFFDDKYKDHIFIVELSSFQLESIHTFKPFIATILNVHEDHLDRYPHENDYLAAKKKIFMNQTYSDFFILNNASKYTREIESDLLSQVFAISLSSLAMIYVRDKIIYYQNKPFFDANFLKLLGMHNVENAMFVVAIGMCLNINTKHIFDSLKEFRGVKHRLQFVDSYDDILFYNDSKATTPMAVSFALQSFDKPVILLAGGQSKNIDFLSIKEIVHSCTKEIFLFGEMAEYLKEKWEKGIICLSMKDAFWHAVSYAEKGDIILLSPGGISFGEYRSFEERGDDFIELIQNYKDRK